MKKSIAISFISILAVAAIAFGILYFTNNADKTGQIEALTANVTEKESRIKALDSEVADKSAQIETLTAGLAEKKGTIETLNADITDKAGQIESLNANVTAKESKIKTLDSEVADKAAQIETLTADLTEKKGTIETLNADIADKAGQIEALNADVTTKTGTIEQLNADVTEKTKEISSLTTSVSEKMNAIESLKANVAAKDGQIEQLKTNAAENASTIDKLNSDIASKAEQIGTLNAAVADRDKTIETLKTEIEGKAAQIETLNGSLKEKDKTIETLNSAVSEKSGQVEELTTAVNEKDSTIESLNLEVAAKAEQIATLNAVTAEQSTAIETLKTEMAAQKTQIDTSAKEVSDKAAEIALLNTDIAGKGEQINVLTSKLTTAEQKITELEKKTNYGKMTEEDLLSVVSQITSPLESLGYSVMVRNYQRQEEKQGEKGTESVESSFLKALQKGLEDRWAINSKYDISTMTDAQFVEYYTSIVMCELNYIKEYNDIEFADKTLEEYAHHYISALQDQLIAVSEFYGKDDVQYNEYWTNGYYNRAQMIYWINRKYGLTVSKKNKQTLTEMIELGAYTDQHKAIEKTLTNQLKENNLEVLESNKWAVTTKPFVLKNDTAYTIESLDVYINLYNAENSLVQTDFLSSLYSIAPGKTVEIANGYFSEHFDHYDYKVVFYVSGTVSGQNYYEEFQFTVSPSEQMGWNGTVTKEGKPASGQAVFALEDITADWSMNSSSDKTLYVPRLKFSVKNTGDMESNKVTVHVIFIDHANQEVWDEETAYVIDSADGALKPGYSKKTFVYSSVGYTAKTDSVPALDAEIYVNDVLIETVTISK